MDELDQPTSETLFQLPPRADAGPPEGPPMGPPRLQRADRSQLLLRPVDLDGLLPTDHRARLVWAFTEGLDLSAFHARIRAVEGHPGRPPIDPAILLALWLYATLEGLGSARALARACDEHDAYRWLAGGVSVNHHTLADFRVTEAELLDGLLAQSVAALITTGQVTLHRVAQDGIRVRASAGTGSYRGRAGLERALADAEEQVASLRRELDEDPGATGRRVAAARQRAASERLARVREALERLPALEAARARKGRPPEAARASTTDPQARIMRLGDGGYAPAWNGQLVTDVASGVIVGATATSEVTDAGLLGPAVEALVERHGRRPEEALADGGYVSLPDIAGLARRGTRVYAPPRARPPGPPRKPDPPGVAEWRARMATAEAQLIYRLRAASAEWVNAQARNRGLRQLRVRGRERVRSVLLWFALAHNLDRSHALRTAGVT